MENNDNEKFEKLLAEIYKLQHFSVSQKSEFSDFKCKLEKDFSGLSEDVYNLQSYLQNKVDDVDFLNLLKKQDRNAIFLVFKTLFTYILVCLLIFLIIRKLI